MAAPRGWRYNAVANTYWTDEKVITWPEDSRTLGIFLLTNDDRTAEGFYNLSPAKVGESLAWSPERLEEALEAPQRDGFCTYDLGVRVVLIHKAMKYHPPRGDRSLTGAVNALDAVHGAPGLFDCFLAAADRYAPEFAARIRKRYGLK